MEAATTMDLDAMRGDASPHHVTQEQRETYLHEVEKTVQAAEAAPADAGGERVHPCSQCNRSFPTDHYKRDQTKDAGIQSICRSCRRVADVTTGIRKHLRTSGISFETDEQVLLWMRFAVNAALAGDSEDGEGNLARALISFEDTIADALGLAERPWNGPVTHSVPAPVQADPRVTELRAELERLQGDLSAVTEKLRELDA